MLINDARLVSYSREDLSKLMESTRMAMEMLKSIKERQWESKCSLVDLFWRELFVADMAIEKSLEMYISQSFKIAKKALDKLEKEKF